MEKAIANTTVSIEERRNFETPSSFPQKKTSKLLLETEIKIKKPEKETKILNLR